MIYDYTSLVKPAQDLLDRTETVRQGLSERGNDTDALDEILEALQTICNFFEHQFPEDDITESYVEEEFDIEVTIPDPIPVTLLPVTQETPSTPPETIKPDQNKPIRLKSRKWR